eukprot:12587_1
MITYNTDCNYCKSAYYTVVQYRVFVDQSPHSLVVGSDRSFASAHFASRLEDTIVGRIDIVVGSDKLSPLECIAVLIARVVFAVLVVVELLQLAVNAPLEDDV